MSSFNFSGIASGIDSSSLIDSILQRKRKIKIDPLREQQSGLEETSDTMKQLKKLLTELKEKGEKFRVLNGGGLQSGVNSTDESVATAKSLGSLATGTYNVSVTQRAQNGSLSYNDRFSSLSSTAAPLINDSSSASDRTMTIQVGSGASQESVGIELTSTSTASDIVEKFNSQSNQATASLINVGTTAVPSYALSFTSKNSGTEKGTIGVSLGSAVTAASAFTGNSLSQAKDTNLYISGISGLITRSTNTINDLIPGLSLEIGGIGTSTLVIGANTDSTVANVKDFVTTFNKVASLIKDNDTVTQEKNGNEIKSIFGSLSGTALDESIYDTLRQSLSGITTSKGGSKMILADIGITSERDGTLKFDDTVFKKLLSSNPSGVSSLLENVGEALGGTKGKIAQFTQYQGLIDKLLQSNKDEVKANDTRIGDIEVNLNSEQTRLRAQFAKLESTIGAMNSQQATLSRLLR